MAGRPSKPVDLILLEGNKDHRTKAQLEYRKQAEQALYTGFTFKESKKVKDNPVAHATFRRLKKLFAKISFVDGLDEQMINRYCLETAEVEGLEKLLERMNEDVGKCEDEKDRIKLYDAIKGVLSTLHRKREMLLKLEDRLFLNPASRVKAVPKQPPREEKQGGLGAFMKRRAESNDRQGAGRGTD